LAEWTGLEPATLGVTGRYSNQLNYHSASEMLLFFSLEGALYGAKENLQALRLHHLLRPGMHLPVDSLNPESRAIKKPLPAFLSVLS
jgi:hypothetical protein